MAETTKPEPKLGDAIPEKWLKEAEAQLKSGFKVVIIPNFRGEKDVSVYLHTPDSGDESEATDAYTKAFNRLIKDDDLMTRDQMAKILAKKEIWGDEQEKQVEAIQEEMRDVEFAVAKMRKKGKYNKAQMNRFRISWKEKREQVTSLLNTKNGLLSNTIEGRAEEQEIKAKLSLCVKTPDGERIWGSLEEFNREKDKPVVLQLLNEAIIYWSGLTPEIISELPVLMLFGGEQESENSQEA